MELRGLSRTQGCREFKYLYSGIWAAFFPSPLHSAHTYASKSILGDSKKILYLLNS